MTTYEWSAIRQYIIDITGDGPFAEQENRLTDAFQRYPAEITQEAKKLCDRYRQGLVRSVWPILDKYSRELADRPSPTVTASPDREKKIQQAKQEIRATIAMLDRWSEVEDILYGHGGRLVPWKDDGQLRHEMEMFWVEQRPVGEQIEREELERADAWNRAHPNKRNKGMKHIRG